MTWQWHVTPKLTFVSNKITLVLVCKRPALGQGKQRLAKTLGAEKTLLVARHLLDCALEDLMSWQGNVVISPAHQEDQEWASRLLVKPVQVLPQVRGNLGQRLNALDQQLRFQGHQKLIFIGSDAPALSSSHYHQITESLNTHDIALCPAQDGGVTIMANQRTWPDMSDLVWSTEQLDSSLTQRCQQHQLSVTHIQGSYDIDTQTQLIQLKHDLKLDERPARQTLFRQIATKLVTVA